MKKYIAAIGISLFSIFSTGLLFGFVPQVTAQISGTNGKIYYTDTINGGCFKADPTGANEEALFNGELNCGDPQLSPDGSMIAFVTYNDEDFNQTLYIANLNSQTASSLITSAGDAGFTFSWSADSSHLVVAESNSIANSGVLKKVAVNGTVEELYQGASFREPTYNADASRIVMVAGNDIVSVSASGQSLTNHTSSFAQTAYGLDTSPTVANTVLFLGSPSSGTDPVLYSLNISNNTVTSLNSIPTTSSSGGTLSIAPDGTQIHITRTFGSSVVAAVTDNDGDNPVTSSATHAKWGAATNLSADFDITSTVPADIPGVPDTGRKINETGILFGALVLVGVVSLMIKRYSHKRV